MRTRTIVAVLAAGAVVAGCASQTASNQDYDAMLQKMLKSSFRERGIAKLDRLEQDPANAACSRALGQPLPPAEAARIEEAARRTIRMPADGKFLGDWRVGEKLAQNGRGMTWTDKSAAPSANGANCYNCHQLSPSELSYGTIGPSLYQYGKQRGVTDPSSAAARPVVEYTWAKLWNAKATNACSGMPRFGDAHLLDEKQLKDVMALLLDPASPVNH